MDQAEQVLLYYFYLMKEAGCASEASAAQTIGNVKRSILTMEPTRNLTRNRPQWPSLQYQITRTISVTHGYR
jgi:hypothetical protein